MSATAIPLDASILIVDDEIANVRLLERTHELELARLEVLERLAQAVEFRDDATGQHTKRVGANAARISQVLGLEGDQVEPIRRAAPLHDAGKVVIPDSVLLKPGRLTPDEFEVMKAHTTLGAKILSGGRSELMRTAEQIALTHHERWDGSVYPQGLAGDSIPLAARIVAVVDVLDALGHDRPHRKAWPHEQVLAEIERGSGTHFDPAVVEALLGVENRGSSI